jgi:hypothetical protein
VIEIVREFSRLGRDQGFLSGVPGGDVAKPDRRRHFNWALIFWFLLYQVEAKRKPRFAGSQRKITIL